MNKFLLAIAVVFVILPNPVLANDIEFNTLQLQAEPPSKYKSVEDYYKNPKHKKLLQGLVERGQIEEQKKEIYSFCSDNKENSAAYCRCVKKGIRASSDEEWDYSMRVRQELMLDAVEAMKRGDMETSNKITVKMASEGFLAELSNSCRANEK